MTVETLVFGALADETRREVLLLVASSPDGATATALAARLPVTRQAIAKHLAVLESALLVTAEKRGRERVYRANARALELAARYLVRLGAEWDQRMAGLRDVVEGDG